MTSFTVPRSLNVAVTGSAGFLGRPLCEALLRRSHRVMPIDLADGCDIFDGSITSRLQDIEVLVHLAGPSSSLLFVQDPAGAHRTAIDGLRNVLHGYRGRFVFPSSCTIYGESAVPVAESQPLPSPPNLYAAAKVEAEAILRQSRIEGQDVRIARIFTGYGAGELDKLAYASTVSKFIYEMIHDRRPTIFADGQQSRDYVFIADIVAILIKMVEADRCPPIVNVGTGIGTSSLSLVEAINSTLGTHIMPRFIPAPIGYVGSIVANPGLAHEELGWRAETTLQVGVRSTCNYLVSMLRKHPKQRID